MNISCFIKLKTKNKNSKFKTGNNPWLETWNQSTKRWGCIEFEVDGHDKHHLQDYNARLSFFEPSARKKDPLYCFLSENFMCFLLLPVKNIDIRVNINMDIYDSINVH